MILIPEIETVVILVPRVASTALKNAVLAKYPKAVLLYRHMEADGVPYGYDRWPKVGMVRNPVSRLWNLYTYLRDMKQEPNWSPGYADRMRATVADKSFEEWILTNETVFTEPYIRGGQVQGYWPKYAVLHSLPENRKSQFIYLRPDLGTEVFRYVEMHKLCDRLDLRMPQWENGCAGDREQAPELSLETHRYLEQTFAWDFARCAQPRQA